MSKLRPRGSTQLETADGWLELGNHVEANVELEKIAPQFRAHPEVLKVRWQIYAAAKPHHTPKKVI